MEAPQDDPPGPPVPENDLPDLPESGPPVPENDLPDLPESDLDILMIPFSTLLIVNVTALRIWTRLFRPTRHTRYHALRIPALLLRGQLTTILPTI